MVREYTSRSEATTRRVVMASGRSTTVHVVFHAMARTRLRLVELEPPRPVQQWCAEAGVDEAMNGGFFTKPAIEPLGELRLDGELRPSQPFRAPWSRIRGALHVAEDGTVTIAPRSSFGHRTDGSLLQAAPLLVHDGRVVVAERDPEGLSTTSEAEFDSDISAEPLPRMAIAITAEALLAISADGRSPEDDGLDLVELAHLLVHLGALSALNLDGGSSSSLVIGGARRNWPRDDDGVLLEQGYPTPTALAFEPRVDA